MIQIIKTLLRAVRSFRAADFAVFKICLLAMGILLGAYFSPFFTEYISAVWIVAVVSFILLIVRIISVLKKKQSK